MRRELRLDELAARYLTGNGHPTLTYIIGVGWLVAAPWTVLVEGMRLDIPAGFGPFDLASVPRILWPLIAPMELSVEAALTHDALYRYRGRPPAGWLHPDGRLLRRDADRWFSKLMASAGVAPWKRRTAWLAVRAAGWWPWWRGGRPAE